MKRILIISSLLLVILAQYSCTKSSLTPEFKDIQKYSIYSYLTANSKDFSSFIQIIQVGGLQSTLSAYNPYGNNYTCFAPNNQAIDNFIKQDGQFGSLAELLKDVTYVKALARYHVVNLGVISNDFPFGAFTEPTLSGDYLNVNFIIQTDTTYYKINNQAPVIKANIETSNGYVHVISEMLRPITLNSFAWLKRNPSYSIFVAALEATGISKTLDVDMKLKDQPLKPYTMLVEADSIYKKRNINSFDDLVASVSPGQSDYTNSNNPLNLFAGYHILIQSRFLNDLVGQATNYNTFADIPLAINGKEIDIMINRGKEQFVFKGDTTDFVGIYYDASNVVTQSGAIHFVNQILRPQVPSRATVSFEFWEEPKLNEFRIKGGTYLIENHTWLENVTWSGADLYYIKSNDVAETSWNKDYLQIDGDFTITYKIPKIVAGKYNVLLGADSYGSQNALVEVYIDGNKLGGLIDLTQGASASYPWWPSKSVGAVDFKKYDYHIVQVKALIPGRFKWDYISFEPI
ncbi:MAG: fasciclin domain-containing protein [Bacteroidia bacterium]